MGWSCEARAGEVMRELFRDLPNKKDGIIYYGDRQYIVEPSTKEYPDGRIYMVVYRVLPSGACIRTGGFYILPGGRVSRRALRRFPFLRSIRRCAR